MKTSPRDVFLHLLAIVTLYTSAISFLALVFECVNYFYPDYFHPDPLQYGYYTIETFRSSIRWWLSVLIVVFPVYVITSYWLNNEYFRIPEKRNARIRKWLLNLTLFIAALVIMGNLATLVYNFLGGELTARFLWKVLAVFFVAGSIFGYYFWDLRRFGSTDQ